MFSRRVCTSDSSIPRSGTPVSASGISPQNDCMSPLGSAAGMFFRTAVGAPLLAKVAQPVARFVARAGNRSKRSAKTRGDGTMPSRFRNPRFSATTRVRYAFAGSLCLFAICLAVIVIPITRGANPSSGSVSESNTRVNWTGQFMAASTSSDCGGPSSSGCDNFGVSFTAPSSGFGPYLLEIKLQPQGDWDMQFYGPNGTLVDGSGNSPGVTELVTLINPPSGDGRAT